jgi:hypothetical protein
MATRKRRSARRRVHRAAANPRGRRRTSASLRTRRANPLFRRRRRFRRRLNPVKTVIFIEGGKLAISGALIGFTQPIVRSFVGQWLGSSPIASAGITFGTAYLLSMLSRLTSFTRKLEDPLILSGATIVAAQLLSAYVLPLIQRTTAGLNPTMSGRGMRGIGVMTGIPPNVVLPPPPPPAAAANGLQGIGARPGSYAY